MASAVIVSGLFTITRKVITQFDDLFHFICFLFAFGGLLNIVLHYLVVNEWIVDYLDRYHTMRCHMEELKAEILTLEGHSNHNIGWI